MSIIIEFSTLKRRESSQLRPIPDISRFEANDPHPWLLNDCSLFMADRCDFFLTAKLILSLSCLKPLNWFYYLQTKHQTPTGHKDCSVILLRSGALPNNPGPTRYSSKLPPIELLSLPRTSWELPLAVLPFYLLFLLLSTLQGWLLNISHLSFDISSSRRPFLFMSLGQVKDSSPRSL